MKRSSLGATWVGALAAAGAALLFQGGAARAQYSQCEVDADCGLGFVCNESTFESCSGGWSCDEEGCWEEPGECTTYEQNWCASATCETNADCPSYMLCQAQTQWTCDGGAGTGASGAGGTAGTFAGMAGFGGAAGGDPNCHEEPAPSLCIQRHLLPCEEASDCGGGFDCVESYYYECSGGGSAGAAGMVGGAGGAGGAAGMEVTGGSGGSDEPWECHQVPSGEHYCSLQNLSCERDAECPSGLECGAYYEYPDCMFVPGPGGEGGAAGGVAGTGSAGMGAGGGAGGVIGGAGGEAGGGEDPGGYYECPPPEVTHRCQPISHHGGGGMGGAGGGPAGEGGASGASGGGTAGAAGMSAENPGSGNAGAGGAGDDDGESDERGHGHGRGRGRSLLKKLLGCSASGPVEGHASMGWLMLGLAAVVLRRRTRRD